ncbi:GNAT family N-acetyltransferase [Aquimarina agarivorans]|uniref:GNAT family N-acetyltransferase n=1 Tax=Aquimarina agarivorans TaxID=980584 RepID=UPI000248F00D|nr:GNAT family N-acetyltransferase [Aquimarina agarivorans]
MIKIIEVASKKQFLDFVNFPNTLYKDHPCYVPAITKEELNAIKKEENPVYNNADAAFYLAYKNDKIVGRIAAIANWIEIKELNKPKVRFGWFDFIDDINVTKALIETVVTYGKKHNLSTIEGPVGFSNMDKAGMLTKGFDELNTMITWYNAPYYSEHLKQLGFEEAATWVEFKIDIPTETRPKVVKVANIIQTRYKLKIIKFKKNKEILPYVNRMFELLNKTYDSLQTFVPIQQYQIDHYKKKYLPFVNPDYITCVANEHNEVIAFSIIMPSFSKALQKAGGKLFPFGFLHILKAQRINDTAAFYLIGVDPEYQNKGVAALIFKEMNEIFLRNGIKKVETNPELIENKAIQALWKDYVHKQHKERKTFRKKI